MSKGDAIEALVNVGGPAPVVIVVEATKAGRKVTLKPRTGQGIKWLDLDEVTRTNRPTGNRVSVRADAVISLKEIRVDVVEAPAKKRTPKVPDGQMAIDG